MSRLYECLECLLLSLRFLAVFSIPSPADKFGSSFYLRCKRLRLGADDRTRNTLDFRQYFSISSFGNLWTQTVEFFPKYSHFRFEFLLDLFRNIISCPGYVYSGTCSTASPFGLIHVSELFIINVVFYVLICSPATVLTFVSSFTISCSSPLNLAKKTKIYSALSLVRILPLILRPHLLLQFSLQICSDKQANSADTTGSHFVVPLSTLKFSTSNWQFILTQLLFCIFLFILTHLS